jgi:putative SOS response-associated peptidase YedK
VPSHEILAFAGVWRPTEQGKAYAFLTCEPNPQVAPIHKKPMPVVLHPEDRDCWLDDDHVSACAFAQPFPAHLMAVI